MELYVVGVLVLSFTFMILPRSELSSAIVVVSSAIFIVEIVQYHFYLLLIRPYIDATYIQYSSVRTIILTLISIASLNTLYADLYLFGMKPNFVGEISAFSAWAFSVGQFTGSGYAPINVVDGPVFAIVSASEQICGVFFLVVILALALSRLGLREIGNDQVSRKASD
ncbi:MAG: hypothetical protein ABL962_14455 [Fimbriimonadaceae bacterium]